MPLTIRYVIILLVHGGNWEIPQVNCAGLCVKYDWKGQFYVHVLCGGNSYLKKLLCALCITKC